MRTVGILGGMGPEATVLLMQRLLRAAGAEDDSGHIHLVVDQNPQVPSRIAFLLEGRGEDPAPVLAAMARGLEAAGAEALAMPCNTAHHFAPAIRDAVTVPFLDMVTLAVARARALAGPGGRVGVLASPAVRRTALFEARMAAAGLEPLYPEDEAALLSAIRRIKAAGADGTARDVLGAVSAGLVARGARVQMIACTEFSLIADAVAEDAVAFDTLDVLVEAIRDFALCCGAGTKRAAM
ncbi:MAG: amino acid racemase [Albidovulum sp.]|jgi:aspartate racemase|uniref:aspartate/glutamate racemase family protein n=1 Tax=Albidovulum sp. TaxID=1872424 RepID=UPI0030674658